MKRIVSLLTAVMLILICIPSVFAASVDAEVKNLSVTAAADEVTVSGSVEPSGVQNVSYVVLYPGKTKADITPESFKSVVAATGEFKTNEDGSFSKSFMVKDNTDPDAVVDIDTYYPRHYNIQLSVDGYAMSITKQFDFSGSAYVSKVLAQINEKKAANDEAGIKNLITKYYTALSVNCSIYEEKIETITENYDEFIKLFTKLPQVSTTNFSELKNQFTDASITTLVNKASTDEDIVNLLKDYEAEIGIKDSTEYETYKTIIEDKLKKEVRTYILNHASFNSTSEIAEAFKVYTVMRSINGVVGWDNIRQSIEKNAASIRVSTTSYIDLTKVTNTMDKSKVYGAMVGQNYADYAAVIAGFNNAVAAASGNTGSGVIINGGSGGGSGSGGGAGFPAGTMNSSSSAGTSTDNSYFNDLSGYDWAKEAIESLAKQNIINGKGGKTYDPASTVLREEFVKMIVLASGKYDEGATVDFNDVDSDEWYYTYIASAVKNNIVSGVGDGLFGTGDRISREDMAVIIARLMGFDEADTDVSMFSDGSEIADYAKAAVAFAAEKGIIKGDNGRFNPKSALTRAEAAVVLDRYMAY